MSDKKRQDASDRYKKQSISNADRPSDADEARDNVSGQMQDSDAAEIALAAVDELADQASEIEALRAELETTKDQLLRKVAEFQNYRRRTEDERSKLVELGKSIVIDQLLDVLDDLRRTVEAAAKAESEEAANGPAAFKALKDGVELVFKKFSEELTRHGVEPIEAVGESFDENLHEALMQREIEGREAGVVIEELQKGYRMGDRVLRHSKVIVSA